MAFLRREARVIERFRIIEVAEAESVTEAARRFDCSRTTVYKLIARYRESGLRALMNRPRGPQEPIPEEVVDLVVELKASAPHRATSKVQQLLEERYGIRLSRRAAPAELRKLLQVEMSRLVRRDATISLRGQRFAVPPELLGKHVWVGLLGDDIVIEHAGRTVATYSI